MLSCTYNIKKVQKWLITTSRGNKLISYGRGALAIHFQVLAETGMDIPVDDIQQAITYWKTEKYPVAWDFLSSCQNMALDPGYVENAWGRRRYFPPTADEAQMAGFKRESGNFPIQSTIADYVRIACRNLRDFREKSGLGFKLVLQIHDALLLLTPEDEVDDTRQVLALAIESVRFPLPHGGEMGLSAEIEVFKRWGEKTKK